MDLLTDPQAWLSFLTLATAGDRSRHRQHHFPLDSGRPAAAGAAQQRAFPGSRLCHADAHRAAVLDHLACDADQAAVHAVRHGYLRARPHSVRAAARSWSIKSIMEIRDTVRRRGRGAQAGVMNSFWLIIAADRHHRHRVLAGFGVHRGGPRQSHRSHGGRHRGLGGGHDGGLLGRERVHRPASDHQSAGPGFSGARGVALIGEALDWEIPKGYLYFAMAFSAAWWSGSTYACGGGSKPRVRFTGQAFAKCLDAARESRYSRRHRIPLL